jgi:hypothetical protein
MKWEEEEEDEAELRESCETNCVAAPARGFHIETFGRRFGRGVVVPSGEL